MSMRRCAKNSLASVRIRRDAKTRLANVSMRHAKTDRPV